MNALTSINIGDTVIRQTATNQYCINDLHKAAGSLSKNQPSKFLLLDSTKELIQEINKTGNLVLEQNQAVKVINGGNQQGTYVAKELVYAYAMWISPKFSLQVIRAYDALATQPDPDDELTSYYLHPDGQYRLERPDLAQGYAIPAPLTLAQFNQRQKALDAAQAALSRAQIIVTAADLLPKPTRGRKTKITTPKRWLSDEVGLLHEMRAQGHTFPQIAQQLGRTVYGVVGRYKKDLAKGGAA